MSKSINLAEARKNLPELANQAAAGESFVLARRGRDLAVIIGIDEYKRLKDSERQQRDRDFDLLLAPPGQNAMSEEEARELAVKLVDEVRAHRFTKRRILKQA